MKFAGNVDNIMAYGDATIGPKIIPFANSVMHFCYQLKL